MSISSCQSPTTPKLEILVEGPHDVISQKHIKL